jgi:hypothetical protein
VVGLVDERSSALSPDCCVLGQAIPVKCPIAATHGSMSFLTWNVSAKTRVSSFGEQNVSQKMESLHFRSDKRAEDDVHFGRGRRRLQLTCSADFSATAAI